MLAACVYMIECVLDERDATIVVNTLAPEDRFRFHVFGRAVQRWIEDETWN